jgi:hypothetical protein
MKTNIRSVLASCVLFAFASVSQASINMNALNYNASNPALGPVWLNTVGSMTFDVNGNPVVSSGTLASNFKVDFLFGSSSGNLDHSSSVFTVAGPGFMNGGTFSVTALTAGGSATIFGGQSGFYQMRAWNDGAASFSASSSRGSSAVTSITFGGANSGNTQTFAPVDLNVHSAFAIAVPEPATIALGLIGAAGLLIRRRK